jgi:hypothetical protein
LVNLDSFTLFDGRLERSNGIGVLTIKGDYLIGGSGHLNLDVEYSDTVASLKSAIKESEGIEVYQ